MPDDARSSRLMSAGGGSSGGEEPWSYDGKRKAEMTVEERACYDRERNRLHARNTRARKKQYMEELKERVESMHAQRAAVQRKKDEATREKEEQLNRWQDTLKKVLDLRCEGVTDAGVWKEVLSDNFRLSLPMTPYRPYDPADVEDGHRRVLLGVEGMIADTTSLTEMCVSMAEKCLKLAAGGGATGVEAGGQGGHEGDVLKDKPRVHWKCFIGSGELLFAASEGIMGMFNMRTVNAGEFGSPLEVEKSGMLRAAFAKDGRLKDLDMMFDGVAVHQQLQRATGSNPSEGHARPAATVQREGGHNTSVPDNETPERRENVPPVPSFAAPSVPGVSMGSPVRSGDGESRDKEGSGGGGSVNI